MDPKVKEILRSEAADFRLPRYDEIPDVGLYLEQTVKYINGYATNLKGIAITGSMIGNYVKKGLVANPQKKQYGRDQIAHLFFISVAKNVLSLENIGLMITLQQQTYENKRAYDYFCRELENVIRYVFGCKETLDEVGGQNTDEKIMLRNTIIAAAHKIYLECLFGQFKPEQGE